MADARIMKRFVLFSILLYPMVAYAQTQSNPADQGEIEIQKPAWEGIQVTSESHYQDQVNCERINCVTVPFDPATASDWIQARMEENAGRFMIDLTNNMPAWEDKRLDGVREYLRQTAKRSGRVIVEPLYVNVRGGDVLTPPSILDVFTTTYSIANRIYNYFHYSETENYHAKILYNPIDRSIALIYFVHRRFGDICTTLYSQCDTIEYLDEETFDLLLSARLEEAIKSGRSTKIFFRNVPAYLPSGELNVASIKNTNSSVRIYKWMVAAGETEKVSTVRSRFIPFQAVVAAVKYSLQVYDMISAAVMYSPARSMKAQIVYDGAESGGKIQSVVFTPRSQR